MSEYMRPMSSPLDISSMKKPRSSDMGGHLLGGVDVHGRAHGGLAAVLVGDGRGQLHAVLASVEGVDYRRVLLGHVAPAHLAGASHLGVVGLQVLGEEQEAPDLLGLGERLVAAPDLLGD